MSKSIKVAIVGIGNCASSLIQGIYYYKNQNAQEAIGLMHWEVGGYRPQDIEIVAAFDIDARKVGKDVNKAIFAEPNCTKVFEENLPPSNTVVQMGAILDGVADHMQNYEDKYTFKIAQSWEPSKEQIVRSLQEKGAEILLSYLPVGSEEAARFYAQCALEAGLAYINCMPVFIVSDPKWAQKFEEKGLPIIGDDIKAQMGATITHRTLANLFAKRGVKLERTYQLNTGGNTDFLNMLNRNRLASKKTSKTEAVQSILSQRMEKENIHIGPSDYVPWQKDNKIAFIRLEGKLFGDVAMNMEVRLSVEDSPNSAGVSIDAIRCCKIALDNNISGILEGPSAFFMKHPPVQHLDEKAHAMVQEFIGKA